MLRRSRVKRFSRGPVWRVRCVALTLSWAAFVAISISASAAERKLSECYGSTGTGCGPVEATWAKMKGYQQSLIVWLLGMDVQPSSATSQERRKPDSYPAQNSQADEFSALRDEIRNLTVQLSKTNAPGQDTSSAAAFREDVLQGEQEKREALARELADLRKQLEAAKADRSQISESEERAHEDLDRERSKVTQLEASLATARQQITAASQIAKSVKSQAQVKPTLASIEADRLLAGAQALLREGDIAKARKTLQLAIHQGSAEAAFLLGETYDQNMLSQWNVVGAEADEEKARELYRIAYDAAHAQAKQHVETTGQNAPERRTKAARPNPHQAAKPGKPASGSGAMLGAPKRAVAPWFR